MKAESQVCLSTPEGPLSTPEYKKHIDYDRAKLVVPIPWYRPGPSEISKARAVAMEQSAKMYFNMWATGNDSLADGIMVRNFHWVDMLTPHDVSGIPAFKEMIRETAKAVKEVLRETANVKNSYL
ncbi:hypothetical protein WJX72_004738 [[Myrmecia] bisecta]|uniref:Luciferase n=1 Tax=[Myrmecia] bisecta TaxID=41462 RepID=A0AAW1PNT3_9CHLO